MSDIKPSSPGQSINGIMSQMSREYKLICRSGKDLLGEARLFCGTLSKWIELETGGREGLGLWLEREGKDLQLLVKAGIEGAERIWLMWMELEHEDGRGLAANGEFGNGRPKSSPENLRATPNYNSNEHVMTRLVRDIHSEETPPERKQQLQTLLSDVKGGAKSVHRAAVAAGYRRRSVSVPSDDANRAIAALLKHYSREQLLEAISFATSLSCQERQNSKI